MSNITNNRLSVPKNPELIKEALARLQEINDMLPFLTGLTKEERIGLLKMKNANKLFVRDALDCAKKNPNVLPAYIDIDEFEKDIVLYDELDELILSFEVTLRKLRDTRMLAGSEAYQSALAIYKMCKTASQAGVAGTKSLYDYLKIRFKGQGSKKSTEEHQVTKLRIVKPE